MEKYIGTKEILARPMNRADYNTYRNWQLSENENGSDEGYLVEYIDSPNQNHPDHKGYISWSPKDVFESSYFKTTGATFGMALEAVKKGKRVAREGWNGKGMYLYYVPANSYPSITDVAKKEFGEMVPYGAYIAMKTAQNNVVPWLASQTDMLSTDWCILD